MLQFLIVLVIEEGQDWYSVVDVEGEAKAAVVDYQDVFQVSVTNDAQIFD